MEVSCVNAGSGRRLTMCQPEILFSPFSLVAVCLSALPVFYCHFFSQQKYILNKHNQSAYSLDLLFLSPFGHLQPRAFMTCAAMFHPLQSYSRTRTHSQNIKTFLLYTIVFLRLSVVAFVCEGSSSAFTYTVCAGCSNELLLVDKLLREQMESLISTQLVCVEEKITL